MGSKMWRKPLLIAIILWLSTSLYAQTVVETIIEKRIESLIDQTENAIDVEAIIQNLYTIYENPININGDRLSILLENYLITEYQYFKINEYREIFGSFSEIEELRIIEGFNDQIINNLRPFITLQHSTEANITKFHLKRLRQHFLFDYFHPFQKSKAYQRISEDEFKASPNSVYPGEPFRLKGRYKIENQHLKSGFIFEKDPGEVLFNNAYKEIYYDFLNRNISKLDYLSAHLMLKDLGFIKKLIIGDYQLQFGQGLGLWSNMGFGKSSDVNNIKKYASGVKANTSSNENHFFRGFASTVQIRNWNLSLFYSTKNRDANLIQDSNNEDSVYISSIQNTGLHRTINELNDKQSLNERISGFNISYRFNIIKFGTTFYTLNYNLPIYPTNQIQNNFKFRGNSNRVISIDYQAMFNKTELFGEIARSKNKKIAVLSGLNHYFNSLLSLSIIYRNYSKEFQNPYAEAFSESSDVSNEKGIYVGIKLWLSSNLKLSMYTDHFSFPWLRSQQYSSNHGSEQLLQIDYVFGSKLNAYLRYKQQQKLKSLRSEDQWFKSNNTEYKKSIRLHLSYQINEQLKLQSRIEWSHYKLGSQEAELGSLIFQDLQYSFNRWPLKLTIRYASFNTDSYQARIYTYENDLLYHFSIPSFADIGNRFYILAGYKLLKNVDVRIKYGVTVYKNRTNIGSGKDQIEGSKKSELKFQLKLKF